MFFLEEIADDLRLSQLATQVIANARHPAAEHQVMSRSSACCEHQS